MQGYDIKEEINETKSVSKSCLDLRARYFFNLAINWVESPYITFMTYSR